MRFTGWTKGYNGDNHWLRRMHLLQEGQTNLCRSAEAIGFHYPGAMAPYVRIPAKAVRQKHPVDVGDLNAPIASLSEPMSCAINNISRVPQNELDSVLIIGLGPLGMLHALCLKERNRQHMLCRVPGKRMEMVKQMGFQTVLGPMKLMKNTGSDRGEGFDLVIVTAPHNETVASLQCKKRRVCILVCKPSGRK